MIHDLWRPSIFVLTVYFAFTPQHTRKHTQPHTTHSIPGALRSLETIDFTLTVYFACYWLLRLWLSERRTRFVLSWPSAIDAVTILPVFISFAFNNAGVDAPTLFFLRILRILRVLRLFNMTQVG